MTPPYSDVSRRHDFILLFDVTDGNPNGDPDAGNMPRVDPETMQGLVSDVSIKRKVRNWIDIVRGHEARFKIYIQSDGEALNTLNRRAYEDLGIKSTGVKQATDDVDKVRAWMCYNFYDIRMFGAAMATGVNCGKVHGPLQILPGRSIDPVVPIDLAITRVAITREEDAKVVVSEDGSEGRGGKQTEMGRKSFVPYGLYRAYGFFSPHRAPYGEVTNEDLDLFWQAVQQMWDLDRSASRGMLACRGLYIFSHASSLGNAPAHVLFERVQIERKSDVVAPRSFRDYFVTVDDAHLPAGVMLTRLVG